MKNSGIITNQNLIEDRLKQEVEILKNNKKSKLEIMFEERAARTIELYDLTDKSDMAKDLLEHDERICKEGIAWARTKDNTASEEEKRLALRFKPELFSQAARYYFHFLDASDGYDKDFNLRKEVKRVFEKENDRSR